MNQLESSMAKGVARVMRTARKQCGLNQRQVATQLGITQGNLSKMENGFLIPSAPQWFEFCEMVSIAPSSLRSGFLDRNQIAELKSSRSEGGFVLPKEYSESRGSKVRAMLPFLFYFEKVLGVGTLESFLEALRLDPDFFVDLDHQINLRFCLDISRYLIGKGLLHSTDLSKMLSQIHHPEMHGSTALVFQNEQDPIERLRRLFVHSKQYECNFEYRIEETQADGIVVSIIPGKHLEGLSYRNDPTLGRFLCEFKQAYFLNFARDSSQARLVCTELQCHYSGADRCIYHLSRRCEHQV